MKYIALCALSIILLSSCTKNQESNQSNDQGSNQVMTYGSPFDRSVAQDISNLSTLMQGQDSVSITLTAVIEKTCAVKGCWMQLKTNDEKPLRVTFKDYGFFVPKDGMSGKTTAIQGYCVKQETSIEELRHYAKDAGETEAAIASITAPRMEYNFVASGVMIDE